MATTIAVLGGTGKLGRLFVQLALDAGPAVRALDRNPGRENALEHPNLQTVVGDATKLDDVTALITGTDVVVSCLGNVGDLLIMDKAAETILAAAAAQPRVPRCMFISSVGCGGTSWLIKQVLTLMGSRAGFADYEAADLRIREQSAVPCVLVRPYALTDKPGTGRYHATEKQRATFMRSISRADVARFLLDVVTDTRWDGKPGVQMGGAR